MHVFHGYRVLAQLHQSENSQVFRATPLAHQHAHNGANTDTLILKILNKAHPSPQEIARFKRQHTIGMRFTHPNITRPLGLMQEGGRWAVTFADSGGQSLDQLWPDGMPLPTFFTVALQLCAALKQIHAGHIIHKDINPSNLIWNGQRLEVIDFGIASELSEELAPLQSPSVLEGTLRYLSPEQSGRMNRIVDYRTDYYSMGATLYHLLAGQPPFAADDPMELVHCHLACTPNWQLPPLLALPPQLLSVLKRLLEKNAELRYQSMDGLRSDLELCQKLALGGQTGHGAAQTLLSGRDGVFQIPQKLFGRERETAQMLACFEQVAAFDQGNGAGKNLGKSALLLVAGNSGIGKSALVHEIHKPIVAHRGYFVAGKFDQFRRNIPYSSLVQAFQDLIRQILSEPEGKVAQWAARLRAALGANAGVIAALIPELCHVIGDCAAVESLPPVASQNRLNRMFGQFVQAFAGPDHPLALFLDDLQWADQPTLDLIERFLRDPDARHLLIIGAYRDNEVGPAHPLSALLARLQNSAPTTITLSSLAGEHIAALVAETLQTTLAQCADLTDLCQRKTLGNPFFLTQFLRAMHDDGFLAWDFARMRWSWDMPALEQADYTDNVVELMLGKIRRLPPNTQYCLQLAASLGAGVDLPTIALVSGQSAWQAQQTLWPALEAHLLRPLDGAYKYLQADDGSGAHEATANEVTAHEATTTGSAENGVIAYRFLHDRVQQAAYALADEAERPRRHLEIGRHLLRATPLAQQSAKLFNILEQLNAGRSLITDPEERINLARLNHQAGLRARLASAYRAALRHMQIGFALLPPDAWRDCHELAFELQLGLAETAYLSREFDLADAAYPLILEHCRDTGSRYRCFRVQSEHLLLQGRFKEGMAIQIEALRALGIGMPRDEAHGNELNAAIFAEVVALIRSRNMASILEAGEMQEWRLLAAMEMLHCIFLSSFMAGLYFLYHCAALSMVKLTLQHGNCHHSAHGFCWFASMLITARKEYRLCHEFGKLGIDMADRRNHASSRSYAYGMYAIFVNHWSRTFASADRYYDEGLVLSMESGNLAMAGYIVLVRWIDRVIAGRYLPDILDGCRHDLPLLDSFGQLDVLDRMLAGSVQPVKQLMGLTRSSDSYDDGAFSEQAFLTRYADAPLHLAYFYHGKIRNAYLFDSPDALVLAERQGLVAQYVAGHLKVPEAAFFAALIRLRAARSGAGGAVGAVVGAGVDVGVGAGVDASAGQAELAALMANVAEWAQHCPANFADRACLLEAEAARNRGDIRAAMALYLRTIGLARDDGHLHIEALANELYGDFMLDMSQPGFAMPLLEEAHRLYQNWGATAKAAHLRARYTLLENAVSQRRQVIGSARAALATEKRSAEGLDMAGILKANHALASEVGLERVLQRLMEIVLQNAGARRAHLLLRRGQQWQLAASADPDGIDCALQREVDLDDDDGGPFPLALLRYVARSGEVRIEERKAPLASELPADSTPALSLMCLPIKREGRVVGLLYLENNLTRGAFTLERVDFLRSLAVQALISIDNAGLYRELEQKVEERTSDLSRKNAELCATLATLQETLATLQQTQQQLILQGKMAGLGTLTAGVAHEINNPTNFAHVGAQNLQADIAAFEHWVQELLEPEESPELVQAFRQRLGNLYDSVRTILNGTTRIKGIVKDLGSFTRLDEADSQALHLSECLDSTLNLVRNSWLDHVEFITQYDDDPEIECWPALLNQVFMNLLINACQAIASRRTQTGSAYRGRLWLRLREENAMLIAEFEDEGGGIPHAIQARIMEPFYTTKDVGSGTGLGLSISFNIVKKHGGTLDFTSTPGVGSCFAVRLPLQ